MPNALSEFRIFEERGYKIDEWFALSRAKRATILGAADEWAKLEYWMNEWSKPET